MLPGWAGGGNWLDETVPEGAAWSGSGRVESSDEKRVLEQPATVRARETASRPSLETIIATSAAVPWPFLFSIVPTRWRGWQNFNRIWLK